MENIYNMAYADQCSGTVSIDQSDTTLATGFDAGIQMPMAVAQKFKPTSKCLNKVVVNLQRILDNDMYIEIRKTQITGDKLPEGNPQSAGGRIAYVTIPYSSISISGGEVEVILNATFDDFDMTNGVWIIVCLYAYDPSATIYDDSCIIKGGDSANTVDKYEAHKIGLASWVKESQGNYYFKSFKQIYSPPGPVLTTIQISPVSVNVNINGSQQLTVICKDQNGTTMTCSTLTWSSTNSSIAIVSTTGLVTGVAVGTVNIRASSGSIISNISTVTVSNIIITLTTIQIPASITININESKQINAICKDQNGSTMSCPSLIWSSSDTTKVTISSIGVVNGKAIGTSVITASSGSIVSNVLTVTVSAEGGGGGGEGLVIGAIAIVGIIGVGLYMKKKEKKGIGKVKKEKIIGKVKKEKKIIGKAK